MTTIGDRDRQDIAQANAAIGLNLMGVGLVFLADNFLAKQPLGLLLLALGGLAYLWSRRRRDYAFFTLSLALAAVGLWFLLTSAMSLSLLGRPLFGSAGPEPLSLVGIGLPAFIVVAGLVVHLRKDEA